MRVDGSLRQSESHRGCFLVFRAGQAVIERAPAGGVLLAPRGDGVVRTCRGGARPSVRPGRQSRIPEVLTQGRFAGVDLNSGYLRQNPRRFGRRRRRRGFAGRQIFGQSDAPEVYDLRGILENQTASINTFSKRLAQEAGVRNQITSSAETLPSPSTGPCTSQAMAYLHQQ